MASTSVEDVTKMTCDELLEALRKLIPDERHKGVLKILEDENIDGEQLLELPDDDCDPDLKEVFVELPRGDKARIRKIVQGIKNGSLKFGQADSNRKPVEPDMPWCTTQTPDDVANGSGNGIMANDSDMQGAWMPANAVWTWKNHKIIYVEFLNVGLLAKWSIGDGQPMNTDTILRHANTWYDMGGGEIPRFVQATHGKTAQIRVSFNNNQLRNSSLGMRAQNILAPQPTMNLDLHNGCPSNEYKIHLIIHEFGHALGLGHEHQRSLFWSCVKPFTDVGKMKQDVNVSDKQFAIDWKENVKSETGPHTTDYDPDSIMHYSFKVEWLTNGYSVKKKVEDHYKTGILSDKVAKALLGVHKRHDVLADKPSDLDIQLLKKVYGGGGVKQSDGPIEQEDYDDHVPASGPDPRTGTLVERRITSDNGISMDAETDNTVENVPAKRPKVIETPDEPMYDPEYNVEVTNAYLSRLSWTENGKKQVIRIYDEASHKWHEIGENLGIDPGILIGIGRDGRDERDRVIKVLGKWYENACGLPHYDDYPKTWGGLLKLLDDSDLGQLAKKVHKALLQIKKPNGGGMAGGPPAARVNGQNDGQDLTLKDLDKVNKAVRGARSQWYPIGLALEIDPDDLDSIKNDNRGNPDGCLMDVLKAFLRQDDPKPTPSWKRLADAMASLSVGRGDIAKELRKQYC